MLSFCPCVCAPFNASVTCALVHSSSIRVFISVPPALHHDACPFHWLTDWLTDLIIHSADSVRRFLSHRTNGWRTVYLFVCFTICVTVYLFVCVSVSLAARQSICLCTTHPNSTLHINAIFQELSPHPSLTLTTPQFQSLSLFISLFVPGLHRLSRMYMKDCDWKKFINVRCTNNLIDVFWFLFCPMGFW